MSQTQKEEASGRPEEPKKQESPPKTNPFTYYVGNPSRPEEERDNIPRKRSSSRQERRSRNSHSRSRERENKDKKYPQEAGYRGQQDRSYGSNSRDEGKYGRDRGQYAGRERGRDDRRDFGRDDRKDRDRNYAPRGPGKQDESKDDSYFKTKLCPLSTQGGCTKGPACGFAHGEKELRGLPNFRKTRLCIPFKNGECPKSSNDCKYAHGEGQIRKLAYDYFPDKNRDNNRFDRDRPRRNDRGSDRYEQRGERDRYQRNDRHDRGDRDSRYRERDGSNDRYRDRYNPPRDYSSRDYQSSRNSSTQPPPYYMSNYNSAYMIPPPGMPVYSSDMYSSGPPASSTASSTAMPHSSQPPSSSNNSGSSNPQASSSSYPNTGQNSYSQPPIYGMAPGYEYGYGYMPHNYPPPPFNPSSKPPHM